MKTPPTIKLLDLGKVTVYPGPGQYRLIEKFPITFPDGTVWEGTLWSTPSSSHGRRIQVRTLDGAGLWDSDNSFCIANVTNALDNWLAQFLPRGHLPEVEPELAAALDYRPEEMADAPTPSA